MIKKSFTDLLKRQGYKVTERKLGGGFVNDVKLITAHKGDQVFEYVLKKYSSERNVKNMLRGYAAISSIVKIPGIVYHHGNEVVYELVKGKSVKDMIIERDPKAPEAVRLLAKELEKLHQSKNSPPQYKKGNSPDENRMLKDMARLLERKQISRKEASQLVIKIREYIPKNKTIIHGDAHLGNFMYSNGELYFIDPDNVKISDYNADIGKVLHAIQEMADNKTISQCQASELNDLFLATYNGENSGAINLYKIRTPLIQLKYGVRDLARRAFRRGLEEKIAAAVLLTMITSLFVTTQNSLTGMTVNEIVGSGSLLAELFVVLIVLAIIIYFFFSKRKN